MKKMFLFFAFIVNAVYGSELPSYQCTDIYEASFIEANGSLKPEAKKTTGRSKLNIMIDEDKDKNLFLNANGNKIEVINIKNGYIYAVEFTGGGMHTWVLFKNKKDNKTYLTISKTYEFFDAPLTSYSIYKCEQVNNHF